MKKFYDITIKNNIYNFFNSLNKNCLIIYSPTSKKNLNLKFNKALYNIIDTHKLTKKIKKIDDFIYKNMNGIEHVIGIGGGTSCDIVKYISYKKKIKCTYIPTMLSTNAYSTDKVALIVDDKKETLVAKLPDKIILDINMLKKATLQNLYGISDIFSIHTALFDWNLSAKNNEEMFDEDIYNLSFNLLKEVKFFIANNDLNYIINNTDKLFFYIGEAGHITNLYGSGRPESGSEHIFAKELENKIEVPHGIAVSLGIILMSIIQKNINLEIIECINKLKILEDIKKYKISKKIIEEVLLCIKPRKDRYSIINEVNIDYNFSKLILDEFERIVKVNFYVDN